MIYLDSDIIGPGAVIGHDKERERKSGLTTCKFAPTTKTSAPSALDVDGALVAVNRVKPSILYTSHWSHFILLAE